MRFKYKIMLLEDYVKYETSSSKFESVIMTVFCSFLNRNSLEFIFNLIQSDFLVENLSKHEVIEEPIIVFVFFPVSPSIYINSLFESYLEEFNGPKSNFHNIQIDKLLEKAQNVTQNRYRQYKNYCIQDINYTFSPKQEKYKVDKYLFGDLAAQYLDKIGHFPYILLKERMYEGIPLNFTLNSFISNVIFKELDSISSIIREKKPTERVELSTT